MKNLHNTRKNILLIPSAIGLSHLTRLVLIALELKQQNAEVAFAFKDGNEILRRYGFKVFPVSDVVITDFSSNVFASYTQPFIEQCVKEELKVIEAFKPDVIVGDFRLTAAISSKVSGIPYISVVNAYMTDYFNPVDVMISKEKHPWKYRISSTAGKAIQAIQKRALVTPFRAVAKKYRIHDLVSLYDFLTGDLTLIADLPQFCPLENLPSNFHYIGPLIWEGLNGTVPEYLEHIDSSKKLIYATTGNTGKETFIQLVVDAFKEDKSYEVVLTTGAYIDPEKAPKASNIHVEKFIPGSKVMKKCHAVIHCGGNGTTYQAISQGLPSVVIPFNNDQKINAWLIKKNKLGIPLSPSGLKANIVRMAAEKVIHDIEIQKNLQHFKSLLTSINGPKSAADEIISFKKG